MDEMVSDLKAVLLDVVKLQAKRLYAADDSSLVTNQTDPNSSDVICTHGGDGVQSCVARSEEVVFILAHFDRVEPVADGDEQRVVWEIVWGVTEALTVSGQSE